MRYQGTETDENGEHPADHSMCEFDILGECCSCGQTINKPEILAREFSRRMVDALSERQMESVISRNLTPAYGQGVCASHDYIDANMIMEAAFVAIFGEAPPFSDSEQDAATLSQAADLWSQAWNIAKANHFYKTFRSEYQADGPFTVAYGTRSDDDQSAEFDVLEDAQAFADACLMGKYDHATIEDIHGNEIESGK